MADEIYTFHECLPWIPCLETFTEQDDKHIAARVHIKFNQISAYCVWLLSPELIVQDNEVILIEAQALQDMVWSCGVVHFVTHVPQ
jgi:hypothetical protein